MATKIASERPHGFNERWTHRIIATVEAHEAALRNNPYQAKRWPIADSSPGNRYGILATALSACALTPAMVNEYVLDINSTTGNPLSWIPLIDQGNPVQFPVIDPHGVSLPAGRWVSCIYSNAGDIWVPVAAHCGGKCVNIDLPPPPPPPPGGCDPAQTPVCPPGSSPCCVGGVWQCCSSDPPVPGDCGSLPNNFVCGPDYTPCCIDGYWFCCYTGAPIPAPEGGAGGGGVFAPLATAPAGTMPMSFGSPSPTMINSQSSMTSAGSWIGGIPMPIIIDPLQFCLAGVSQWLGNCIRDCRLIGNPPDSGGPIIAVSLAGDDPYSSPEDNCIASCNNVAAQMARECQRAYGGNIGT